jgi:hypothetical protein
LYVVTQAGTDKSVLQRIQDPAAVFQVNEDIATRFIVPEENWWTGAMSVLGVKTRLQSGGDLDA